MPAVTEGRFYVFISYASDDRVQVLLLVDAPTSSPIESGTVPLLQVDRSAGHL